VKITLNWAMCAAMGVASLACAYLNVVNDGDAERYTIDAMDAWLFAASLATGVGAVVFFVAAYCEAVGIDLNEIDKNLPSK
jgi:hypothetical protein